VLCPPARFAKNGPAAPRPPTDTAALDQPGERAARRVVARDVQPDLTRGVPPDGGGEGGAGIVQAADYLQPLSTPPQDCLARAACAAQHWQVLFAQSWWVVLCPALAMSLCA